MSIANLVSPSWSGREARCSLVGALLLTVLVALLGASPAHAAGTVTEYPIPVLTNPYGMTTGLDGKIWFVDTSGQVGGPSVGRMATTGAIAASDVVPLPTPDLGGAVTSGPDGNMWVDQDSHIDKVPVGVTATSQITSYAVGSGNGGYSSIVTGPDGRLWFGSNTSIGAITTGGTISSYPTNSASSISSVIVGPDGKLWFGEGNKIARTDTSGHIGTGDEFSLPAGDGDINALVLGPDGNVWFTLGAPAAIGRITPTGGITIFPTPTLASLPFGLAVGPDHRIWFPERNGDKIGSIPTTASSGADITEYPLSGTNKGVLYITAGQDNRMWFSEANNNQLGAITTDILATTYGLAVTRSGTGSGSVSSQPAGISCGATCSASYASGTSVTLTATADPGSSFTGWSGDCAGSAACTVSMTQAHAVTAAFTATPPPVIGPPSVVLTAPANGATYSRGQLVSAGYSCSPGANGGVLKPGAAGCSGPVANGARVDTSGVGVHAFVVSATDVDGQSATVTSHYTVKATGPLPAPIVSRLRISPAAFAAAASGPSATTANRRQKQKRRPGAKVSYRLSAAASVRFTVQQRLPGRTEGHGRQGRCVTPTRHNRKAHQCRRTVTLSGSFTQSGKSGANSLHFNGRLNAHELSPGTYTLVATPTANHKTGDAVTVGFRITG